MLSCRVLPARVSLFLILTLVALLSLSADTISLADAVLDGTGTIKANEMPFVNRLEELWQVFRINAKNHVTTVDTESAIKDFRSLRLLFCVQVLGTSLQCVCYGGAAPTFSQ